jgi:hypothetical protein
MADLERLDDDGAAARTWKNSVPELLYYTTAQALGFYVELSIPLLWIS